MSDIDAGGGARKRAAGDIVFMAAIVIAVILVAHIVFVVVGANPDNDIVRTDGDWAAWFATWFLDLFTPHSHKWNIVLNYGTATLAYLFVGGVLRRGLNDALA